MGFRGSVVGDSAGLGVANVARGPDHPARFPGSTDGQVMTLTVTLTGTAVTFELVELVLGREPQMDRARSAGSRPGKREDSCV
jgi:hypothetical protein